MGLRTIVLKLHKPGKSKKELLDTAIANYNEAFRFLLRKAYEEQEEIQERFSGNSGRFTTIALSKWIDKETLQALNQYDVQPFKDSLRLDFGMTMAGYLRLRSAEPEVSFPACTARPAGAGGSPRGSGLRPLYFCRYDVKRCYSLLYDREKDRYYAKLYLANSRNARIAADPMERRGKLAYISKEGGLLEKGRKKESFIIVPLSFGKWQEKTLKEALEKPECLRTAKLQKRDNGYYLAVSVDMGDVEEIKTTSFMGVSRGLKNKLNYTVVDEKGAIISSGPIETPYRDRGRRCDTLPIISSEPVETSSVRRDRGRFCCTLPIISPEPVETLSVPLSVISPRSGDRKEGAGKAARKDKTGLPTDELHAAANRIADIAEAYKAQVILQNLREKGDGITWGMEETGENQLAYRIGSYSRLTKLLEYKLTGRGLPQPVMVSSVDIFSACHNCGFNSKSNRCMKNLFICTACGTTMELETLGSLNLARKLIHYRSSKIKIKVTRTREGVIFSNEILGLNCFCGNQTDHLELLKQELGRFIENVQNDAINLSKRNHPSGTGAQNTAKRGANTAKASMVKKLAGANNFMDVLEYI